MARLRVADPGEVIELTREQLLALIQTDAELSEILMRAFILRRMEIIGSDARINVPGGQAGTSSRVENYLGFPTGISGLDLTGRAYAQALRFGAHVMVTKGATRLACDGQRYTVEIDRDRRVRARAVIIATGAGRPALTVDAVNGVFLAGFEPDKASG